MELEILETVKEYSTSLEDADQRLTVKARITKFVDDDSTFFYETDQFYLENSNPMTNTGSTKNSFEDIQSQLFRYLDEFQKALKNGSRFVTNSNYK